MDILPFLPFVEPFGGDCFRCSANPLRYTPSADSRFGRVTLRGSLTPQTAKIEFAYRAAGLVLPVKLWRLRLEIPSCLNLVRARQRAVEAALIRRLMDPGDHGPSIEFAELCRLAGIDAIVYPSARDRYGKLIAVFGALPRGCLTASPKDFVKAIYEVET